MDTPTLSAPSRTLLSLSDLSRDIHSRDAIWAASPVAVGREREERLVEPARLQEEEDEEDEEFDVGKWR